MTKEQKIKAINEQIGKKTKNLWYKVFSIEKFIYSQVFIWDVLHYWKSLWFVDENWIKERIIDSLDCAFIFEYWKYLDQPIEKQTEECINFIHNMLPNAKRDT